MYLLGKLWGDGEKGITFFYLILKDMLMKKMNLKFF